MQNYLAEKNLVIYFQICTYHLPDRSRYEVEATLKQRRDKVVSELFERCFIVGHLRCINVGKRWKSDIPTGTPRRIHIDSTSILRQYVKDQILTNFHVISTYFLDGISLIKKSTSFPRTFFDVISLVEKSMLFPHILFTIILLVEKSMLVLPWSVSPCFYLFFSTYLEANKNIWGAFPVIVTLNSWLLQDCSL